MIAEHQCARHIYLAEYVISTYNEASISKDNVRLNNDCLVFKFHLFLLCTYPTNLSTYKHRPAGMFIVILEVLVPLDSVVEHHSRLCLSRPSFCGGIVASLSSSQTFQ